MLQLSDAPATPAADLWHETLHERLLPGAGRRLMPRMSWAKMGAASEAASPRAASAARVRRIMSAASYGSNRYEGHR